MREYVQSKDSSLSPEVLEVRFLQSTLPGGASTFRPYHSFPAPPPGPGSHRTPLPAPRHAFAPARPLPMTGNAHSPSRNSRYPPEPHTAFEAPIPNTRPRKCHGGFPDSKTHISSGWKGSLEKQCEALANFLAGDRVPGADRMTPFLLLVELGLEAVAEPAKDKLMRHPDPPRRAGGEREFRAMLSPFVQAGSQARLREGALVF